jgi:hypothetical protein
MIFNCLWKSMENWKRTKNLIFSSGYNAPTLFFKSTKEIFDMQETWHSPNTVVTMVNGQTFCVITWRLWHARNVALSKHSGHYGQRSDFLCYNLTTLTCKKCGTLQTLVAMVNGQTFCVITWRLWHARSVALSKHSGRYGQRSDFLCYNLTSRLHLSTTWGCTEQLCGCGPL